MLGGGRALSSGSVRIYAHACRPFQSGSRLSRSFSKGLDHHYRQQIQRRVSAVQQTTAVEAPPGLLTVPWDDTPEQQQACLPVSRLAGAVHQSQRTETGTSTRALTLAVSVQALAAVRQRLEGSNYGQLDTETIQWFLRDRKFNVDDTVSKLEKMLQWRTEFR